MKDTHVFKIYDGLNKVMEITTRGELNVPGVDVHIEYDDNLDLAAVAEELAMLSLVVEARHNVHKMREEFGAEEFADQNDLEDPPF